MAIMSPPGWSVGLSTVKFMISIQNHKISGYLGRVFFASVFCMCSKQRVKAFRTLVTINKLQKLSFLDSKSFELLTLED